MGKRSGKRELPNGLVILHEDRDLLVVDKPIGLLTIATDSEQMRTAYFIMMDYVRKGNPKSRNRVFIVHRLDKDTSGVLVFAKSEEAKQKLQERWESTEKKYLAIAHGRFEKKSDTITSYLAESSAFMVYSTSDPSKGKLARTQYRVLKQTPNVALLEVTLLTGRKNQIRVHLSGIDHPIVGDRKYGKKDAPRTRLALHSRSIAIRHPFNDRPIEFHAPMPDFFSQMIGSFDADRVRPAKLDHDTEE